MSSASRRSKEKGRTMSRGSQDLECFPLHPQTTGIVCVVIRLSKSQNSSDQMDARPIEQRDISNY